MQAYCLSVTPPGTTREVPVNQGFFVRDMDKRTLVPVATTGATLVDFMYWNFSGRVPGQGGGDEAEDIEEPARWRTATFGALSWDEEAGQAVVKARSGDGQDGLYASVVKNKRASAPVALLKTGQSAITLDTAAPAGSLITSLGLERDGFRGKWLAITAGMLAVNGTVETTWGGVYVAKMK
ncbi:MAG: hypothetical protein RJB26_580, partial [Pseudomonadota bacterium]